MKKMMKLLPLFLAFAAVVTSCSNDDDKDLFPSELVKGAYVVNSGFFSNDAASITKYDYDANEITEYYDQLQNEGNVMTSAPQSVYVLGDKLFVAGNEPDRVLVYNPLWVGQDTITTNIIKPRYFAVDGDNLYVSCWGGNVWSDQSVSYLVKYNMVTGTSEKISLPGGPEGMAVANGKLYVALSYSKKIAVMNLSTKAISYIETSAVSNSMVKDANGNIYVALISSYSSPTTETGLGFINTQTDVLTRYPLDAVSSSSSSILAVSKDNSKVYVVAAAYNANWEMVGGVQVFNTSTKTFEANPLISDVTGINAVSVSPANGDVYVLISTGGSTKGEMKIYSAAHELKATKTVGANPSQAIFLD